MKDNDFGINMNNIQSYSMTLALILIFYEGYHIIFYDHGLIVIFYEGYQIIFHDSGVNIHISYTMTLGLILILYEGYHTLFHECANIDIV